jgi:integrase
VVAITVRPATAVSCRRSSRRILTLDQPSFSISSSRALRHTYCASRLQTLDAGAPVSLSTVAREMGHGGDSLVRRIYGHMGEIRHRAEEVEYRVEQLKAALGGRFSALI